MGPRKIISNWTLRTNLIFSKPYYEEAQKIAELFQTLFSKKTLRTLSKKSLEVFKPLYLKPYIQVYNIYMTRNYFSKRGGPYFVNDGFPKYVGTPPNRVSTIDRIKSFFKSRFKSRPSDK